MIGRILALALAVSLAVAAPLRAADKKPLVLGASGQMQQIQSGDTVGVANGGTGATTLTAHCVVIGEGTSAMHVACPSSAGQVLTDNGASSDPSFQAAGSGGTVTSVTCGTGLSGGTITTTGTCSLTAPVTLALGGTNATSASGTALDNITGFSGTGFLTRTGAGTYAFQSATNGVTLGNIAQIAADSIVANFSGSTANVAARALPSCSGTNDAITYNTTTHAIGCHAPSGAAGGTVTSVTCGTVTITGSGTCPGGELIGVQLITATGSGTYTPTSGTNSVIVELLAGGGGGAGVAGPNNNAQAAVGSGGGGGAWLQVRLTANFSGASYSVGAKGSGGSAGNNNGADGSDTTFTTTAGSPVTYTAHGGKGGGRTSGGVTQVANAALGGAATQGDMNRDGGGSGYGVAFPGPFFSYGGFGGFSAYSGGAQAPYLAASPGSSAGNNATGRGGGGSGAVANGATATTVAGGNGSDGEIIIWEYNWLLPIFLWRRRKPANDSGARRLAA